MLCSVTVARTTQGQRVAYRSDDGDRSCKWATRLELPTSLLISLRVTVSLIATVRSGGQTGVDRGALDAARAAGVPVRGWCPDGGWAEDLPEAPGILGVYPELQETPSGNPAQRTEWNVRDSDVTVIIVPVVSGQHGRSVSLSPGTALTVSTAERYGRPYLVTDGADPAEVAAWLRSRDGGLDVNVAGPRASEWEDGYATSYRLVTQVLPELTGSGCG